MKIVSKINLVLLILLGLASGTAKIMLLPQEMAFFQAAGFSAAMIILFGAIQLVSGILLIFQKMRTPGAIALTLTLIISTILIFMDGKIGFGIFSVLPVLMATYVIWEQKRKLVTGR